MAQASADQEILFFSAKEFQTVVEKCFLGAGVQIPTPSLEHEAQSESPKRVGEQHNKAGDDHADSAHYHGFLATQQVCRRP